MNKKLLLIAISVLVVSCGRRNVKPPVDLKQKRDTPVVVNNESISVNPSIQLRPEVINKEESSIINDNLTKTNSEIKSKKFYYELLNEFCKNYYSRKFKGTSYIYGSIIVERISKEDENTVEVKGAHSFKNRIKSFEQRDFIATIRDRGDNRYNILFRRRSVVSGQWKDTGNIMFTYNSEE